MLIDDAIAIETKLVKLVTKRRSEMVMHRNDVDEKITATAATFVFSSMKLKSALQLANERIILNINER